MLESLNEEQIKPAMQTDGAILVTAGAGSGKTRLLTERISYLINGKGVDPYNILAITFTNKATNEMKERILKFCPNATDIWISTFHSMCARILRENISNLEGYNRFFTIYDTTDKDKLLKKIVGDLGFETDRVKDFACEIDKAKNMGVDPDEYFKIIQFKSEADEIRKVYQAYQNQLRDNNALDFDDLLVKTLELFKTCPNVLKNYQHRFRYIHIDEFQDTNLVQYKIARYLAYEHKNIFVVGDEDQCIYGWRGANIENIHNFTVDFPEVKCYKLERNYRSTKSILNIANTLIKNNTSRIEKVLWTENEQGENPVYFSAYDEVKEAEYVASTIYNLINRGVEPSNIAVLFRLSALSRLIEEKLLSYNLPYVVSGIFKFFERAEIKNVLAYLRLTVNSRDNESLKRIINFPKRGIGAASIDKIENIAKLNGVSMLDVVLNPDYELPKALREKLESLKDIYSNLPDASIGVYNFADQIVKMAEINGAYNKLDTDDNDRLLNISQLMQSIKSFENQNPNCELSDYLESITLQSSIDEADDEKNAVNVSTVHASKGLEFDYVFIVGAEEGLFPVSRAMYAEDEIEEERRLMYVAITRAKRKVYLTSTKSRYLYHDRSYTVVSRFIKEMNLVAKTPEYNSGYSSNNSYSSGYNSSYNTNYSSSYNSSTSSYDANYGNSYNRQTNKYTQNTNNYTQQTIDKNVSTNLQDLMVKKLNNQKSNYQNYTVGTQVLHPKFGIGTIISANLDSQTPDVTINFGKFGNRTLSLSMAPLQILKTNNQM